MPEDRSILSRPGPAPDAQQSYGPHPDQVIDWYLPARPTTVPVVVFIHGGYWRPEYDREHARSAAGGLAAAGFATALIEYRRVPGQPDTMVRDVAEAIRMTAVGPEGSEPRPVIVVGHSAGGHLALVCAADPALPIAGCLALAPLASLDQAESLHLDDNAVLDFLGVPAQQRRDLDPCSLPRPTIPVVVVHGAEDAVVPMELSEAYCRHHATELTPVPATGHFELIDPDSRAWALVVAEVTRVGDDINGP